MSDTYARKSNDFLTRSGSKVTVWVLGAGLLSLHATLFTLTIIGMVFWNIYDAPNDLWVGELFRRWGVLLLFHAIAVVAGWTAWRLLRAEQQAINASRTDWVSLPTPEYPPVLASTWQSTGAFQPVEKYRSISTLRHADDSVKRIFAYSAMLTSRFGSAIGIGFHAIGALLARTKTQPPQVIGSSVEEPVLAWPEGPIRFQGDDNRLNSRSIDFEGPGSTNGHFPDLTTVVQSTEMTGDDGTGATLPSVGKDAGQTWVEAATATWLTPRDDELPVEGASPNGKHAAQSDAARPAND